MNQRKADHQIDELFTKRSSPRAMSGEPVSREELFSLFEAARWAPSSYNNQPWRFVYALKNTPHWENLFNLLVDFNKGWCKNAGVLVVVVSKKTFDHNNKPARTHSFDTGAAWENLALQGTLKGWVVHGMEGFDYDKAHKELKIPDDHTIEAMFAVGKHGKKEDLPADIQKMEQLNDRKKITEFIFEGTM